MCPIDIAKTDHREWVVKTLTAHTERLKTLFDITKGVRDEVRIQNGRVRELEKTLQLHKGAGIFLSCLFTALMILIAILAKT